ncbi:MAG TPA: MOSC N-terminal beta barrel domain-containing protein, partial [Usitatibacter sp.]
MPVTLSGLNIYPVKGLKGIALTESRCTDRGLEHDRRWMVVDSEGVFLTQRDHPRMATVWTDIAGDELVLSAPDVGEVAVPLDPAMAPPLRVRVWNSDCAALAVSTAADAWLSAYLGMGCRLVYMPDESKRASNPQYAGYERFVSFADGYAYLAIGEASLADLNARLVAKNHPALPMNRFRPNLVVSGTEPYAEDRWGDIRVGDAVLRGVKPCGRCQVTTTDQATGEVRGPEPLATLSEYRESSEFGTMFGMNLVT